MLCIKKRLNGITTMMKTVNNLCYGVMAILVSGSVLAIDSTANSTANSTKSHVKGYMGDSSKSGATTDQTHAVSTKNTRNAGFGPQSPRDIDSGVGHNPLVFSRAPDYTQMNLCNIHFHKNAEHRGGEFTTSAGGNHDHTRGYLFSGTLNADEKAPSNAEFCPGKQGGLNPGDTIEVHYVYTTAKATPAPTLGACLSDAVKNPQLRVEAQVYVLVNNDNADDFSSLTQYSVQNGVYQALNIPTNTGKPIEYLGSTTGPSYNKVNSPFQVTWSVRPQVTKVNIDSVGKWCSDNVFKEDHAHGVRNLVTDLNSLSTIAR